MLSNEHSTKVAEHRALLNYLTLDQAPHLTAKGSPINIFNIKNVNFHKYDHNHPKMTTRSKIHDGTSMFSSGSRSRDKQTASRGKKRKRLELSEMVPLSPKTNNTFQKRHLFSSMSPLHSSLRLPTDKFSKQNKASIFKKQNHSPSRLQSKKKSSRQHT